MKTAWSMLVVIAFAFLLFNGVANINTYLVGKNALSNESLEMVAIYDEQFRIYEANMSSRINNSLEVNPDVDPSTGDTADFFKEYTEHKGRFDQIRDGLNLVYNMPTMIMISIPFVDKSDLGDYTDIIFWMLVILMLVIIFVALRNGDVIKK